MNLQWHFGMYFIATIILSAIMQSWLLFGALLVSGWLFDPDNDQVYHPMHRWWLSHSALLPIVVYWLWHPYINMVTAKEFALILFYPMIIHLILDMKLNDLILFKMKEFGGTWQISMFPIPKRMGIKGSFAWLVGNVVGMIVYLGVVL